MECDRIIETFSKGEDILESINGCSSKAKTREEEEKCSNSLKTDNRENVLDSKNIDGANKRKRKLTNQKCQEELNDKQKLVRLENGSAVTVNQRQPFEIDRDSGVEDDEDEELKEEPQPCQCLRLCDCLYKCYSSPRKWYSYYERYEPDFLAKLDERARDSD